MYTNHKLLLAVIASLFFSALCVDVPDVNTSPAENGDYTYQYFPLQRTWDEAEAICEAWGGNLVSIESEEENLWVSTLNTLQVDYWIGLNEKTIDGRWLWTDIDAHEFAYLNFDAENGEPSDDDSAQCASVKYSSEAMWATNTCSETRTFVCKKRTNGVCPWDTITLGAPRPEIETEFDGDQMKIKLRIAKNSYADNSFVLTFDSAAENLQKTDCPNFGSLINTLNLWELIDEEDCYMTYELTTTISEFISLSGASLSSNDESDILNIESNLYVVYRISKATDEEAACVLTTFETSIRVRTILKTDGTAAAVIFSGGDVLKPVIYSTISLTENGFLDVNALLIPNSDSFWLSDFTFLNHTLGVPFQIDYEEHSCTSEHVGCQYSIMLVSLEKAADYSGYIKIGFTLNWKNGESSDGYLLLKLVYGSVEEPPALTNVIDVVSNLVANDWYTVVDYFTPFQTTYVLTETLPAIDVSDAEFTYTDAWLCCTKNREVLPAYNPDQGSYGCTVFDDATMSYWQPLVVDGVPQSELDVELVDLGPLIYSKCAMTFNPYELYGEDKLCYIHTRTQMYIPGETDPLDSNKRDEIPHGKYVSDAQVGVSFKSCSVFQHKDDCIVNSECAWKEELGICWNSATRSGESTGAASTSRVSAAATIVALIVSMVAFLM